MRLLLDSSADCAVSCSSMASLVQDGIREYTGIGRRDQAWKGPARAIKKGWNPNPIDPVVLRREYDQFAQLAGEDNRLPLMVDRLCDYLLAGHQSKRSKRNA